jgi:CarD family transcriptional regulator
MEFKVNQNVVHLSHGVGIVKGIVERQFEEKTVKAYIIEINDNNCPKKVFVPFENSSTRLRAIMDKKTAEAVLEYIHCEMPDHSLDGQTWNMRYREYMERMHTGDAKQIAEVFVALRALRAEKDLSFGERKLLEQARELLSKEFALLGMSLPQQD